MEASDTQILRRVRSRRYRPMAAEALAADLKVPRAQRGAFHQRIAALMLAGELVEVKNKCLADPALVNLMVGTLLCNARGFGFVQPAREQDGEDVYVHGSNLSSAMHGDLVVVRVPRPGGKREAGHAGRGRSAAAEVKVVSVLQRARTNVVGTFLRVKHMRYVVPDDTRLFRDIFVAAQDAGSARNGDKVSVRIQTWPSRHINPTGAVEEVFGPRGQLEAERLSVVSAYELRCEFAPAVLRAAENMDTRVSAAEIGKRTDLRSTRALTIDPEDARDFDDAVSVRRVKNGGWELRVHIADVSHYVRPGDPIDGEAQARGTSVYLPGQVIPMLPENLSNNICSLRPKHVRLTKTVLMRFDGKGRLLKADLYKSAIKSVRRFTYEEVQKVISGGRLGRGEEPLRKDILELHALAEHLRAQRRAAGMLEMDIPEPHILTDAKGRTTGVELRHNDSSHRLIEQCMLAANEAVASYLLEKSLPYLCRSHDEPAAKAIREFRENVRALGFNLPPPGTRAQIQRLLQQIEGRPEAPALHFLLLRSMRAAQYSAEDKPHYAIGAAHYLHFTSPIRRYPDLLAHRILDEYWSGKLAGKGRREYWQKGLPSWMEHASRAERNAEAAERTIAIRRTKDYLAAQTGPMDAMILSVDNYGMRVQLRESLVEGVVRMSSLTDGFYRVDRRRQALVGPQRQLYKVGAVLKVRVLKFDELKYQIEFEPVR